MGWVEDPEMKGEMGILVEAVARTVAAVEVGCGGVGVVRYPILVGAAGVVGVVGGDVGGVVVAGGAAEGHASEAAKDDLLLGLQLLCQATPRKRT